MEALKHVALCELRAADAQATHLVTSACQDLLGWFMHMPPPLGPQVPELPMLISLDPLVTEAARYFGRCGTAGGPPCVNDRTSTQTLAGTLAGLVLEWEEVKFGPDSPGVRALAQAVQAGGVMPENYQGATGNGPVGYWTGFAGASSSGGYPSLPGGYSFSS